MTTEVIDVVARVSSEAAPTKATNSGSVDAVLTLRLAPAVAVLS